MMYSAETIEYHYGKHHAGYVNKLNILTKDSQLSSRTLEDLVRTEQGKVFNLAAQVRTSQTFLLTDERCGITRCIGNV